MAQDNSKLSIDHVEEAPTQKHQMVEEIIALPQSLESLSDVELKRLGRRATWKLDLIIMPAMTMYESLDDLENNCQAQTDVLTEATFSTILIGKTLPRQS